MSKQKKPIKYSKTQIDKAGNILRSHKTNTLEYAEARAFVDQWRMSHERPMQRFNVTLRKKRKMIYQDAVVARRLKRLQTIIDKISNRQQDMNLSRMQDVGGVRIVMQNIEQVYRMKRVYQEGSFSYKLKNKLTRDYIEKPQKSGYRGIHLVFEFYNVPVSNENDQYWKSLQIEMQIRTELQHAWATGVEIVSVMRGENLKAGQGDKGWLELFRYISSIIALVENKPTLLQHRNLNPQDLFKQTTELAKRLEAVDKISAWVSTISQVEGLEQSKRRKFHYTILAIDTKEKKILLFGFAKNKFTEATKKLKELENEHPEYYPVLVAAGDINNLRHAYPNYLPSAIRLVEIIQRIEKSQQ